MRTFQCLLFFVFAGVACAKEPTAKSLKRCPNGHETLKNVKIVYGLPPFEGPAAQEWQKAVENLEIVSGGCVSSSDSPTYEVVCTSCRFSHAIFSTDSPKDGYWTLNSPDLALFPKPISDRVRSFPLPAKALLLESVSYTQSLNDRFEIRYEGLDYTTRKPVDEIKAEIDLWSKEQGVQLYFKDKTHTSTLDGANRDILEWTSDKWSIFVRHEHSDKSSWVYATYDH